MAWNVVRVVASTFVLFIPERAVAVGLYAGESVDTAANE